MTMTNLDGLVDDYLSKLDAALRPLPTAQRSQIVADIAEHVSVGRASLPISDEASLRELLDRIGDPDDIAAAALSDSTPEISRRHNRGRSSRRTVLIVGLVAALVLGGVIAYLAQSGSSTVTMPDVVGKTASSAQAALSAAGVNVQGIDVAPSVAPLGTVFKTAPAAGTVVSPGNTVQIFVSTGPSTVPRLLGLTQAAAMRRLQAEGLHWAVARAYRPDSSGIVVEQTPPRGVTLTKQFFVEIFVSSPSKVVPRTAPYVVSMPQRFAFDVLQSFGFKVRARYYGFGPARNPALLRPLPGVVTAEAPLNVPVTKSRVYIAISYR